MGILGLEVNTDYCTSFSQSSTTDSNYLQLIQEEGLSLQQALRQSG